MMTLWFTPKSAQRWHGTPRVWSSNSSISRVSWLIMWQRWKKYFNSSTPSPISPREPSSSPKSKFTLIMLPSQLEGTGEWWRTNSISSARYSFQFCSPFAFLLVLITLVFNHPGYFIVIHQPKGDLGFNQYRKPLLFCSWAFVNFGLFWCLLFVVCIVYCLVMFVCFCNCFWCHSIDFEFISCSLWFCLLKNHFILILLVFQWLPVCFVCDFSFKDSFRSKQNGKEKQESDDLLVNGNQTLEARGRRYDSKTGTKRGIFQACNCCTSTISMIFAWFVSLFLSSFSFSSSSSFFPFLCNFLSFFFKKQHFSWSFNFPWLPRREVENRRD